MKGGFFGVRLSVFWHKIGLRRIAESSAILQQPRFGFISFSIIIRYYFVSLFLY